MSLRRSLAESRKACNRGAVVAFLNEGQVGCFREDRLVGDKDVGSILKVRWSEKELFDARVLFFGTFDEAKEREAKIVQLLDSGKAVVDETSGVLTIISPTTEDDTRPEEKTEKRKRKRRLIRSNDINTKKLQPKSKKRKETTLKETKRSKESKKDDFQVEVVSPITIPESEESSKDLDESDNNDDVHLEKKLNISFSDDDNLDNLTDVMRQVLPDFQPVKNSTDRPSSQEKGSKNKSSSQEKGSKDKSSSQEKGSKDKSSSQEKGSKDKSSSQEKVSKDKSSSQEKSSKDKSSSQEKGSKDKSSSQGKSSKDSPPSQEKDSEKKSSSQHSNKSSETGKHQKDEDVKVLLRDVKVLKQDVKRLQQRMEKLESRDQTCSTPERTTSSPHLFNTTQALSDARDQSCDTLNSSALNSSENNCNQDDYSYEYEYEGDDYRDYNYAAGNYGGDHRERSCMGTEFTTSSYTDHRVIEYRGNRRTNTFEPGGSFTPDYQHPGTIPEYSSGSISLLKNPEYLATVKRQSSSMFNFAAKLNCLLFTEEERRRSNVSGTQGKLQLDPNKVFAIRDATFVTYPTDILNKDSMWRSCVKAIDEINRRLRRK